MYFDEFIDFKSLSKDLRILDAKDNTEHWNDIMELRVSKIHPNVILYKTSHTQKDFNEIKLKRLKHSIEEFPLKMLNDKPNNISKEKWEDLNKLGTGDIPVVKNPDHKLFFINLPHDN